MNPLTFAQQEISSEVQSYPERLPQFTLNGIFEMMGGKCTVMALPQTPRISIKYCITVKAERERQRGAARQMGAEKESNIYLYLYMWINQSHDFTLTQ